MKISIGTLSRAFDLSDEALRFYEKRGLLHPKRQSGNGYRVFEQADIQRISNIKRLKSQGFSLEEIQRVYSGTAQEDLIALYEQKILEMQRNINCYNHILARMQTACLTLKTAQEELMRPCRVSLGRVYLLEYPSVLAMWNCLPKDALLKRLFEALSLTAYTTLINRESLEGSPSHLTKGILFFEEDAELIGVPKDQFRCIDATCAVGCLFRLENGNFNAQVLLDALKDYGRRHGLYASDDLFSQQLLSHVDASGQAIHYARLIMPVSA